MTLFTPLLAQNRPLITTFIKTPHPMIVEALEGTGLDCLILDGEHAPFDLAAFDTCLLAGRAIQMPMLARVTEGSPAELLRVLDMGADGVLVPHVLTADQAESIVKSVHYGAGGRGYSAHSRAGRYSQHNMAAHLENAKSVGIVVQIEDPEAVENVAEIAAVPGVSAMFVGRADLAVSYGVNNLNDKMVSDALDAVLAAGKANGVPVATFAPQLSDATAFFKKGVRMVAVASEHKPMQDFFGKAPVAAAKGA
ncbi:MAG: aldolase/citrate lyase family protein [Pseudomonadota bacterium]